MLLIYACMMNHFCITIPRHAGHANGHIEQLYMCVVFTILGQLQVLLSLKVNYWARICIIMCVQNQSVVQLLIFT